MSDNEHRDAAWFIAERVRRGEVFDFSPSKEDSTFCTWVIEEVKREHGGRYAPHPPYTDLALELAHSLKLKGVPR